MSETAKHLSYSLEANTIQMIMNIFLDITLYQLKV